MSTTLVVPMIDPSRAWTSWNKDQIFDAVGTGNIVPNVGDLIISYVDGFLRCSDVDYSTGLSVLVPASALAAGESSEEPSYEDVLVSNGPSDIAEAFRVYIDGSVTPHTLALDATIKAYSTSARYVKIFKGTDVENGIVISRVLDETGAIVSENIPLTPIDPNVPGIKEAQVAYSALDLPDGEVVTVVMYNDLNSPIHRSRLLVTNTSFIRAVSDSTLRVSNIELISPFLSVSDPTVLELPMNLPIANIDMEARVRFSNGDSKKLPIDGSKFSLLGLRNFVSTIQGQTMPISLIYALSPNEIADGITGTVDRPIKTASYTARTTRVDNAYSVKLYTYPVWIDALNGYRLQHFIYNLERNIAMDVTTHVEIAANSQPFKPTLYGNTQSLKFSLDLSKISPSFKQYTHVQNTKVTLLRHGTEQLTKWTVGYDPVAADYGDDINADVEFINGNLWKLRIDNGKGSLEHWLRDTYERVKPLYDETSEANPPTPNLMEVSIGAYKMSFGLTMWDQEITVNSLINAGDLLTIKFLHRSSAEDLELAVVGMAARLTLN